MRIESQIACPSFEGRYCLYFLSSQPRASVPVLAANKYLLKWKCYILVGRSLVARSGLSDSCFMNSTWLLDRGGLISA
jgi:hypothetical protein